MCTGNPTPIGKYQMACSCKRKYENKFDDHPQERWLKLGIVYLALMLKVTVPLVVGLDTVPEEVLLNVISLS